MRLTIACAAQDGEFRSSAKPLIRCAKGDRHGRHPMDPPRSRIRQLQLLLRLSLPVQRALPTHGNCWAVVGIQIDSGFHGDTSLDGLRLAGIFKYPQAIHMGNGAGLPIVDQRATDAQRNALLRIMSGQDTRPGATMFQVFFSMLSKVYEPVFADIDFAVDIAKRRSHLKVAGYIEQRGEPIINPISGNEHRIRSSQRADLSSKRLKSAADGPRRPARLPMSWSTLTVSSQSCISARTESSIDR